MTVTITVLPPRDLARYAALGWTQCVRSRCKRPHVYLVVNRDQHGQNHRYRLCAHHAAIYAKGHGLELPQPPDPQPGVLTVNSRGGTFDLCPQCRHWLGRTDIDPGGCMPGCGCTGPAHNVMETVS